MSALLPSLVDLQHLAEWTGKVGLCLAAACLFIWAVLTLIDGAVISAQSKVVRRQEPTVVPFRRVS